jgi:hypothetical protein
LNAHKQREQNVFKSEQSEQQAFSGFKEENIVAQFAVRSPTYSAPRIGSAPRSRQSSVEKHPAAEFFSQSAPPTAQYTTAMTPSSTSAGVAISQSYDYINGMMAAHDLRVPFDTVSYSYSPNNLTTSLSVPSYLHTPTSATSYCSNTSFASLYSSTGFDHC